jgi:hypothetical protein
VIVELDGETVLWRESMELGEEVNIYGQQLERLLPNVCPFAR